MLHPDNEDWQSSNNYESLMNLARKWYIFTDSQMDEFQPSIRLRVFYDNDDGDQSRTSKEEMNHEVHLGRAFTPSQVRKKKDQSIDR